MIGESHERREREPTRRAVLRVLAGAAASLWVRGARAEKRDAAVRYERDPTAVLRRGLLRLREDAVHDPNETVAFFLRKDARAAWVHPSAEDPQTHNAGIRFDDIENALEDPDARLTIFHTHHASPHHASPHHADAPHPPSFGDVYFAARVEARLKKLAARVEHGVVDPAGVWTLTLKPHNRCIKKLIAALEATGDSVLSEKTLEEVTAVYSGRASDADIDWRYKVLRIRSRGAYDSLSPAARHELTGAMRPFDGFLHDPAAQALMDYRASYDRSKRDKAAIRNVRRTFSAAGALLTYRAFKSRRQ